MGRGWSRRAFVKAGIAAAVGRAWSSASAAGAATESVDLSAVSGTDAFQNTIKAVEQLGGMGRFVPKGATVGLLINHQFRNPGAHVSPDVALAVAALSWEAGAKSILSLKDERFTYWRREARHADAVRRMIPCSGNYVTVPLPRGQTLKRADVIKDVLAVD